jgi:hypothetical protein
LAVRTAQKGADSGGREGRIPHAPRLHPRRADAGSCSGRHTAGNCSPQSLPGPGSDRARRRCRARSRRSPPCPHHGAHEGTGAHVGRRLQPAQHRPTRRSGSPLASSRSRGSRRAPGRLLAALYVLPRGLHPGTLECIPPEARMDPGSFFAARPAFPSASKSKTTSTCTSMSSYILSRPSSLLSPPMR